MATVTVQCPRCQNMVDVSEELLGRKARCNRCQEVFVLRAFSLEDTVADWLSEAPLQQPALIAAPPRASVAVATRPPNASTAAPAAAAKRTTVAVPAKSASGESGIHPPPIRLDHVDELGAFFVFPSTLLESETFRRSMPRCCLRCGSVADLSMHVVVWSSKLPDRDRLRLRSGLEEVAVVREHVDLAQVQDWIASLPRVPHLPFPYDLPMPYFICRKCTPSGALMTHVRPRLDGGEDCEIGIASLKRSAEFLAGNLGRDHDDCRKLLQIAKDRHGDPWAALPLAVRNRIETWFHRTKDETFVGYIHDNDFSRAESGGGGLVLTSRRLVYHKFAAHREYSLRDKLELLARKVDNKYLLQISSAASTGKPVALHCDTSATDEIRALLKQAGTTYTYRY